MDRRDFIRTAGVAVVALSMPEAVLSALSGLSDADVERKIKELLSQMTLEEKIDQMYGKVGPWGEIRRTFVKETWNTPDNKRVGIPGLHFNDGPRGIGKGRSTCFPVSMLRGATWSPELEERVGDVVGIEGRAQNANVVCAPCINLLRHPSWGRAQESYGEDPLLLGAMGVAFIRGAQRHLMACTKHFAANSIEGSRFYVDVKMDERTLREIYLPHFKKCVEAGTASVMSAYNDLNGFLCAHNRHLLRDILKGEWGFDGFVVSDWVNAVEDTVAAAEGGLDLEMPTGKHFGKKLLNAVNDGAVSPLLIDEAVSRLLRQKLRFIKNDDQTRYDISNVASPVHTDLARQVASKGIVLLKNENEALPLHRDQIKSIAVIGRLGDSENIGDQGSSAVKPPYVVTPLQGIRNKAGSVTVLYNSGDSPEQAQSVASGVDAAVIVVGCTSKDEGEGGYGLGDRKNLNLHSRDEELIQAVAKANKRVIVIMEAGAAIITEPWRGLVPAILMAWYPGMEGGNAIADILFGEVNPSGKLPIIFPKSPDQLPPFDNKAKSVEYDYYHGYRLLDKNNEEAAFPFGFGLSYTRYKYGNLKLDKKKIGKDGKVMVSVDVTNIGKVSGEEIVQLYVGYKGSKVERHLKDLKAFDRVVLASGQAKTLTLEVKAEDLAYYNMEAKAWEIESIEYVVYVGPSSRKEDLTLSASFSIG